MTPNQPKTVSLETAKKLKEAGWVQRTTEQHWYEFCGEMPHKADAPIPGLSKLKRDWDDTENWVCFDAPDVSELLEALPSDLEYKASTKEVSGFDGTRPLNLTMGHTTIDKGYYALYSDPHPANKVPVYYGHGITLVEALASLWLELKKQKLL